MSEDCERSYDREPFLSIFKSDDRGTFRNFNTGLDGIKRMYTIENWNTDVIRAWHGHKEENKIFYAIKGAFLIGIADMENPEKPEMRTITDKDKNTLYVSAGNYNGIKALTDDAVLLVFSSSTVHESINDDYRLDWNYFGEDIWKSSNR